MANEPKRYWYIYYRECSRHRSESGHVIDEHPLDWRRNFPERYETEFGVDILFFAEIDKDTFDRNNGYF